MKTLLLPSLLATLFVSVNAQAHQLWIEQNGNVATLQYGEFVDNVRETTPGLLDNLGQPGATRIDAQGSAPLTLKKTPRGFTLSTGVAMGGTIIADDRHYAVSEDRSSGALIRWAFTPAARYVTDFAPRQPQLTLDIVPTGQPGQFRVTFKGQPLPQQKVAAVAASGWTLQAQTDAAGLVSFALPWRGMYVLEAEHNDKTAGERDGKPYDIAAYITSLSFAQQQGVAALPARPAGMPGPAGK